MMLRRMATSQDIAFLQQGLFCLVVVLGVNVFNRHYIPAMNELTNKTTVAQLVVFAWAVCDSRSIQLVHPPKIAHFGSHQHRCARTNHVVLQLLFVSSSARASEHHARPSNV
jgi:hypothetical protein